MTDNEDGTYHLSFTPTSVGIYQLNVLVNGYEVMGSPFAVTVQCSEISEIETMLSAEVSNAEKR